MMKTFFVKSTLFMIFLSLLGGFLLYNLVVNIKPANARVPFAQLIPEIIKQKISSPKISNNPTVPGAVNLFGSSPDTSASEEDRVIGVVDSSVKPVVSIVITKQLPVYEQLNGPISDPFVCQFFGQDVCQQFQQPSLKQKGVQEQEVGAGTGFFIRNDGLIITNKHVVERDDVSYTVLTNTGKKYPAKVLARDPVNDLALVKIDGLNFPVLPLGDSSQVKLGQTVIAIGNALGQFSNTVSKGIISGLSRSVVAEGSIAGPETLTGVIQTDAAINPGNSGGPLLNLSGQVIGINTAVAGGAQSIGFALPINIAKHIVDQYYIKGKITYPYIGVRYMIITPEFAKSQNLPLDYGALIVRGRNPQDLSITPGSPADKAGLRENDIILEFNGQKITLDNPLDKMINGLSIGDQVTIKVYSKGETKTLTLTLAERS